MRTSHVGETVAEIILTALIGILFGFFVYAAVTYAVATLWMFVEVYYRMISLTVLPLQFICSIFIAMLSIILFVLALKTGGNVDINVGLQKFFKIFAIVVFVLTILGDVFVFIVHDYLIFL